jgi:hypothetical protein
LAAHVWDKRYDLRIETKLLKCITNPRDLAVWEKLLIKENGDLVMDFDIPLRMI